MAYSKTVWDEATPITAQLLNKMEEGIRYAYDFVHNATAEMNPNTLVWRDGSGHSKFNSLTLDTGFKGETKFVTADGVFTDPWVGVGCSIKATSHIATSGSLVARESLYVDGGAEIKAKATLGGFSSDLWSNAQLELASGGAGKSRLNFHRKNNSQLSLVHQVKDQLHIEMDNGTQYRLLHTGDSSAPFGYNGSTGRITHNGNDVKVLNSVATEQWGGRYCWWGAEGSRPGNGYIQFCW